MYQSPFRFVSVKNLPDEPEALRSALALEKKKLLAEFELAGTSSITLDGRELHRQEVLHILDELSDTIRLQYHKAIAEDTPLLRFLEAAQIEPATRWKSNLLYETAGFLHFISPYYADATNRLLQFVITGKEPPSAVDALAVNHQLREPAHTEEAYRYATRFFTEKKNDLFAIRQRADTGQQVSITEIGNWCSDAGVQVLNRLPDSFDTLRYTLANTLNNLCVVYDRLKKPQLALVAIEAAAKIRVEDEELKKLIPSNLHIIRSKASRGWWTIDPKTGRKKPKLGLIIAVVIILIRIVTAGNSCNHTSTPDFKQIPAITIRETPAHEKSFTSLQHALISPQAFTAIDSFFDGHSYHLIHPRHAGDDPFRPLFDDDTTGAIASKGIVADGTNRLLLRNESDWEAIAIYEIGGRMYGSAYVPPQTSYTISYLLKGFRFHLYTGRGWDDSAMYSYDHYATPYMSMKRVYRGGFRERASTTYEDTTGTPLFERPAAGVADAADTVTLRNGILHNKVDVDISLGGF